MVLESEGLQPLTSSVTVPQPQPWETGNVGSDASTHTYWHRLTVMLRHGAIDYQKAAQTNGRSRQIETKGVRHASIHFTDGLIHGGNPHASPKSCHPPIPCIPGYHVHLHSARWVPCRHIFTQRKLSPWTSIRRFAVTKRLPATRLDAVG